MGSRETACPSACRCLMPPISERADACRSRARWDLPSGRRDSAPNPLGPAKEKMLRWNPRKGVLFALVGAKKEILVKRKCAISKELGHIAGMELRDAALCVVFREEVLP